MKRETPFWMLAGWAWVIAVILFCLLATVSILRGQSAPCDEHIPVCPAVNFQAFADTQWQYILGCSGLTPQPGGDFSDVEWRIVPRDSLASGHAYALGMWRPPNVIELDSAYQFSVWVVRHELLHHLLRGPPEDQGGPHPWYPFAVPCQVMPGQHFAEHS